MIYHIRFHVLFGIFEAGNYFRLLGLLLFAVLVRWEVVLDLDEFFNFERLKLILEEGMVEEGIEMRAGKIGGCEWVGVWRE